MDKKIKKILILSVISLIVIRIISLFAIYYLPNLESFRYGSYLSTFEAGDDLGYYILAEMVYKFDFREHPWTLGFPLMIVPFIFIFGQGFFNVFFPLVIFNSIFLFCVAIALIVWTAFLIFKKIKPAIISGLFFVLFPFLFYIFRNFGPHFKTANWNDLNFFHMNWLTAMSDPLSALLVYLIFFLLISGLRNDYGGRYYAFLGFLTGYALMVRASNIATATAVAFTLLLFVRDKFKKLFLYIIFALIGFLPQFLYNAVFFHSPIKFGYEGAYNQWIDIGAAKGPIFGIGNLFHLVSRAVDYSWLVIPALLLSVVFILLGILYIGKIDKKIVLVVALWFFLPTIFYLMFVSGTTTMRYYLPAVPAFVIFRVGAPGWLSDKLKSGDFS